jgi:hypothetical protein
MKKILLLATAFAFTLSAFAQTATADALIKVNADKHDFGKIIQNTPVNYAFEIKNISDKPVVVENTWASCGCTTPEKIVDPILPGKTAMLKVQYNAAAAAPFTKDVFIKLAGIDQPKTVQITGEVLTAEAYEQYKKGGNAPATTLPKTEEKKVDNATKSAQLTLPSKPKTTKD